MSLTLIEVEEIAHLARLELTKAEKLAYQSQLSAVLDYIAQINELDLSDVPPTIHAVTQHNVMREDVAEPAMPIEDVLHNAPEHEDSQFKIQAILD